MVCALCGCQEGRTSAATVVKTSVVLFAWSSFLFCLFESRFESRIRGVEVAHGKHVEETVQELSRNHRILMAAHMSEMHGERHLQQETVLAPASVSATAAAGSEAVRTEVTIPAAVPAAEVPAKAEAPIASSDEPPEVINDITEEYIKWQDSEETNRAALRGSTQEQSEIGGVQGGLRNGSAPGRNLVGFYSVGTTEANMGCFSVAAAASTSVDMNIAACRGAANQICTGCFIMAGTQIQTLNIAKCSTARYKLTSNVGTGSGTDNYVLQIEVINTDPTYAAIIRGCPTTACSSPVNTYTLAAHNSVLGYCYGGSGNRIYWQTSGLQNANSFDFNGKTITDLGTVTTAIINGGDINGATITGGTIDFSSTGTLSLRTGQIAANKISAGLFGSGTYNFAGSTISNSGTVTVADIDGGTIDGVTISGATIGTSSMTVTTGTLDVSHASATLTLKAGQVAADKISRGTFQAGATYSFTGSTITDLGTVTTAIIEGGTMSGTSITVGIGKTLTVTNAQAVNFGAGQIGAGAIQAGTFNAGSTYSFQGSTIANLGTVTTANIDGGTIDNVAIGGTTVADGAFNDLSTDGTGIFTIGNKGTATLSSGTVAMSKQMGVFTVDVTNLAVWNTGTAANAFTLTSTNMQVTANSVVLASAGDCSGGLASVTTIVPGSDQIVFYVKNLLNSACTAAFKIHFVHFPCC